MKENNFKVKEVYCDYCKDTTKHEIRSSPNSEGTSGDLRCCICGSCRLDKIQGFNANLM